MTTYGIQIGSVQIECDRSVTQLAHDRAYTGAGPRTVRVSDETAARLGIYVGSIHTDPVVLVISARPGDGDDPGYHTEPVVATVAIHRWIGNARDCRRWQYERTPLVGPFSGVGGDSDYEEALERAAERAFRAAAGIVVAPDRDGHGSVVHWRGAAYRARVSARSGYVLERKVDGSQDWTPMSAEDRAALLAQDGGTGSLIYRALFPHDTPAALALRSRRT